jgi:arginase
MAATDVFGVPSSMGAFAPGQERAPAALRGAGLLERLKAEDFDVRDRGDSPVRRWFPDRQHPRAQHVDAVREVVLETAGRVASAEGTALVLGGDCTIGLGTLAGLQTRVDDRVGLLYFDLHADMNVPSSVREGALDWMGLAHALGVDDAEPALAEAFHRTPLLEPRDLWLFAHGSDTDFEREQIERFAIRRTSVQEVAVDPAGAASHVVDSFGNEVDRLAIHLDVDVVDYMDLPVSENADRNQGLSFEATIQALRTFLAHTAVAGLTICEINPDHDPDGSAVQRFVDGLAAAFAGPAPL